jgi:hypothetical protein
MEELVDLAKQDAILGAANALDRLEVEEIEDEMPALRTRLASAIIRFGTKLDPRAIENGQAAKFSSSLRLTGLSG